MDVPLVHHYVPQIVEVSDSLLQDSEEVRLKVFHTTQLKFQKQLWTRIICTCLDSSRRNTRKSASVDAPDSLWKTWNNFGDINFVNDEE